MKGKVEFETINRTNYPAKKYPAELNKGSNSLAGKCLIKFVHYFWSTFKHSIMRAAKKKCDVCRSSNQKSKRMDEAIKYTGQNKKKMDKIIEHKKKQYTV